MAHTQDLMAATMPMALMASQDADGPPQEPSHAGLMDFSSFLGRLVRSRPMQPGESRLRDALVESRRNDRVCPRQAAWLRACVGGPSRPHTQAATGRGLDVLTSAPASESLLERRKQLGQQLAWAMRHGLIDQAYDYLHALPENQWLHFDDDLLAS